jgi:hypothetical protein
MRWSLVVACSFLGGAFAKRPLASSKLTSKSTPRSWLGVDESGVFDEGFDDEEEKEEEEVVDLDLEGPSLNKRLLARLNDIVERIPPRVELQARAAEVVERTRGVLREIKGSHSSEFECAVIKGTRPDSRPAKEKHVARLVETVSTFQMATSGPQTDYYNMLLHKLWARMAEPDWRTRCKALFILHRVAVTLESDSHKEFLKRYFALKKIAYKV